MSFRDNKGFDNDESTKESIEMKNSIPDGVDIDLDRYPGDLNPDEADDTSIKQINSFLHRYKPIIRGILLVILNLVIIGYFAYITYFFIEPSTTYKASSTFNSSDNKLLPPLQSPDTLTLQVKASDRCYGYDCDFQWCNGYGMFLILFCLSYTGLLYFQIIKPYCNKPIKNLLIAIGRKIHSIIALCFPKRCLNIVGNNIKYLVIICGVAAVAVFLAFDTVGSRDRLRSLIGIAVLISIGAIFSKHPKNIKLQPVLVGLTCQFLLGVFCIRWDVGRAIFQCIGDKVATFLNYSLEGAEMVYGNELVHQFGVFAFAVLSAIFFFSFFISIFQYLGVLQWVVSKLGWILQSLLGTTVCESVTCAANIFVGMSESPLLIRPYLKYLTHSEMHVVMASGFATVSGTVLAAYISFGAEPAHLITSSVMAAPATLFFAKLFYPEVEKSQTTKDNIQMAKSTDNSVLDAATTGASIAIPLVLGIIANLIAFVSFMAFLNGVVNWLGYLAGEGDITFEWIFAKLFIPLAWVLGVSWDECEYVANLIATKTIINEFVAYERLGVYKKEGLISGKSAAIATYAVCGFANPSSLGIMIGALSAMCPEQKSKITSVALRAFMSGCIVCFITASIAGLLMPEDEY